MIGGSRGNYPGSIIAVDYKSNKMPFEVYPNPNDGISFFVLLKELKGKEIIVELQDIRGRELFSKVLFVGSDNQTIEIRDLEKRLSPGVYLVTASSEHELYQQKVIIK